MANKNSRRVAATKLDLSIDEAIYALECNYPSDCYSILQNAVDMAIMALEEKKEREERDN